MLFGAESLNSTLHYHSHCLKLTGTIEMLLIQNPVNITGSKISMKCFVGVKVIVGNLPS